MNKIDIMLDETLVEKLGIGVNIKNYLLYKK